jgi:hypothetical protein
VRTGLLNIQSWLFLFGRRDKALCPSAPPAEVEFPHQETKTGLQQQSASSGPCTLHHWKSWEWCMKRSEACRGISCFDCQLAKKSVPRPRTGLALIVKLVARLPVFLNLRLLWTVTTGSVAVYALALPIAVEDLSTKAVILLNQIVEHPCESVGKEAVGRGFGPSPRGL